MHLFVLIHGFMGSSSHMDATKRAIAAHAPEPASLRFLVTRSHQTYLSMDGIDICGERVLKELAAELAAAQTEGRPVTHLSLVGYSMGGLVARYVAGRLHQLGTLDTIEPVNFVTIAAPHLGIRRMPGYVFNHVFNWVSSRAVSHSGAQMALDDTYHKGLPLLVYMSLPDSIFIKGFERFRNRVLYANTVNDRTVPYTTAAISASNPYRRNPNLGTSLREYPHVRHKSAASSLPGADGYDAAPGSLTPSASMTDEAEGAPARIAAALGGEAGVTLLAAAGESASDDTGRAHGASETTMLLPGKSEQTTTTWLSRGREYSFYTLLIIIGPIVGLIVGPIIGTTLLVLGAYSRLRVYFSTSKADALKHVAGENSPLDGDVESARETAHREHRQLILRNLNRVGWKKVDVHIPEALNSHGVIVARRNGFYNLFPAIDDQLRHLAQKQLMYT
eukprot:Unigene7438_Nuclearia_a/m.22880 Unigene7438_Nuclearia_a/g.22880  ORF Unigene7438_Nuclearia_a/g.22880 Unigene7438_Nuclearia_a/m.22880 type:complete len:448 (+) Unigene7438_Nuclearia_a:60-1403(+)